MSTQNLIPLADPNPAELFVPGGLDDLIALIEADARSIVADVKTLKGRNAIRSNAAKVTSSKTYIDTIGKDYVAALKAKPRIVDAARKVMRDYLDGVRDDVRRPLTDWEYAEKERKRNHSAGIESLTRMAEDIADLPADSISGIIHAAEAVEMGEKWQEFAAEAASTKDRVLAHLRATLIVAQDTEAKAAEADRNRIEAEEIERRKREHRIAQESAENAKLKAEEHARAEAVRVEQDRRAEDQKREGERLSAIRHAQEAERRAEDQKRQQDAAAAERMAKHEEDAKRIEADAKRHERERIEAERQREAKAAEQRAADKEHKLNIDRDIMDDLSDIGLSDEQGRNVIAAISLGQVRHVEIRY